MGLEGEGLGHDDLLLVPRLEVCADLKLVLCVLNGEAVGGLGVGLMLSGVAEYLGVLRLNLEPSHGDRGGGATKVSLSLESLGYVSL